MKVCIRKERERERERDSMHLSHCLEYLFTSSLSSLPLSFSPPPFLSISVSPCLPLFQSRHRT